MKPKINNITDLFPQREIRPRTVYFVIHHEGVENSSGAMAVNEFHQISNNWRSIAYHFYIGKTGKIYQCLELDKMNASEKHYNDATISICLQGNFDKNPPGTKQRINLLKLLKYLDKKYPDTEIKGHGDLNIKSCPGKHLPVKKVIEDLKNKSHFLHFLNPTNNEK